MFKESLHIPFHTPPTTSRSHEPSFITNIFSTCHQEFLQKQQRELLSREQLFPYCQMSLGRTLCTADLEGHSFILVLVASSLTTWRKFTTQVVLFTCLDPVVQEKIVQSHLSRSHNEANCHHHSDLDFSCIQLQQTFHFRSQSVRVISGSPAVTFRIR